MYKCLSHKLKIAKSRRKYSNFVFQKPLRLHKKFDIFLVFEYFIFKSIVGILMRETGLQRSFGF